MRKAGEAVSHISAHQIPSLNQSLLSGLEPDGAVLAPVNDWSLIPTCGAPHRAPPPALDVGGKAASVVTVGMVVVVVAVEPGCATRAGDDARTAVAGTNANRAARIMPSRPTGLPVPLIFTSSVAPSGSVPGSSHD